MDKSTPATKKDLQESEGRLRTEMGELRTEMGEIRKDMAQIEGRVVDRLTELVRDVETSMLTAFHGYGRGQASRMHLLEVADSTFAQRLAALEDRMLNLETRRGPGTP